MNDASSDDKKKKKPGEAKEDLEFEDIGVEPEESQAEILKRLRDKLKACVAQKQEYMEGWQRAKADLINARRRDEEERGEFLKFANKSLILELLPALDSFEAAFADKDFWEKAPKEWRAGVENISAQIKTVLSGEGLKEYSPLSEKFDPAFHSAVSSVRKDGVEEGVVVEVLQRGYMLGEKLIRPPKVVVSE